MEIKIDTRVGEIVRANFKTAQVFDAHNIDFCCGGGMTLEAACNKASIPFHTLLPELENLLALNDPDSIYIDGLELDELCDYIEKRHHGYVTQNIPFLMAKLDKLCGVHGENHPELFEVNAQFKTAAENLSMHLKKEELTLFPYIKNLVKLKNNTIDQLPVEQSLQDLLQDLHDEHEAEGSRFEQISQLTSSYLCPPDGCQTFQVTYQTLRDFEADLHRHVHLENNVLFKKAQTLENKLLKQRE